MILPALVVLPALAALASPAGDDPSPERFDAEGPLRNDAFLASSERAEAELARGDRAWVRFGESADRIALVEAFDAWQGALSASSTGDAVRPRDAADGEAPAWPDPDGTQGRRAEGVAASVARRLDSIGTEVAAWTERFAPRADAVLAVAEGDTGRLARLEREYPRTPGAARAALRLGDLAFERGRAVDARAWLERASAHAPGADSELADAVERRRRALEPLLPSRAAPAGAWSRARSLELERAERLVTDAMLPRRTLSPPGGGVEPGLVLLADGSAVIQSPIGLVRLAPPGAPSAVAITRFDLREDLGVRWERPYTASDMGGWPLLPASDGRDVVVVLGRAREGLGNALACLRFDDVGLPRLRWALTDAGPVGPEAAPADSQPPFGGPLEFQPGPAVHGQSVFVQVRARSALGDVSDGAADEIWLLALDLADGRPTWRRFLTRAADLRSDAGARFRGAMGPGTAGQPLGIVGDHVFVGTNVGLAFLFDAVDGRLEWAFRGRRRAPSADGWPGSRRPLIAPGEPPTVFWAAFDSDRLYALSAGPPSHAGVLTGAPRALGEARMLVAAGPDEILVAGRDGRRRALRAWLPSGERRSSLYLGEGERF